jgi:hypothetical protein
MPSREREAMLVAVARMSEATSGIKIPAYRFAHAGYWHSLIMNTNALEYWVTRFRG